VINGIHNSKDPFATFDERPIDDRADTLRRGGVRPRRWLLQPVLDNTTNG
jgi:hypothetical protein